MPKSKSAASGYTAVLSRFFSPTCLLALVPSVSLAMYWAFGEQGLIACALVLPVAVALLGGAGGAHAGAHRPALDSVTGLPLRDAVVTALDHVLCEPAPRAKSTACIVVSLEGLHDLCDRFGAQAGDLALKVVGERLSFASRSGDVVARLNGGVFALALSPTRQPDLETLLQISGRLQDAVREPISIDATATYLSCSVGFCLPARSPAPKGSAMLAAAETAMREARAHGPGAIRAFSADLKSAVSLRKDLVDEISEALDAGHIRPWFQPQISTDTGAISGFEALARWRHPAHGMIVPGDFLGAVEQAGLSERLSQEIVFHAFSALHSWDRAGIKIPTVGVNFSGEELRNPKLVERIRWELDRFDLTPDRLTVEVLETVVSGNGDDVISRNIAALANLGCGIDLDDFGTGHASIAAIRRFAIRRLKIDRSFVTRVDQDREQQTMISAILTMSERLGLDTLAEGVETMGEHAILAQLGCGHIQGYGIARPMPFEDTIAWIRKHQSKTLTPPLIGRQTG